LRDKAKEIAKGLWLLALARVEHSRPQSCVSTPARISKSSRYPGYPINPDAYFAITDTSKPEGKDTPHYFLEIEQAKLGGGKNGEPQIIRKLAKYCAYYNSDGC
jgi:hypothetical protein